MRKGNTFYCLGSFTSGGTYTTTYRRWTAGHGNGTLTATHGSPRNSDYRVHAHVKKTMPPVRIRQQAAAGSGDAMVAFRQAAVVSRPIRRQPPRTKMFLGTGLFKLQLFLSSCVTTFNVIAADQLNTTIQSPSFPNSYYTGRSLYERNVL